MDGEIPFVRVGYASELEPGVPVTCEVEGRRLLVVNVGDEFFCMADRCSHANTPLSSGRLRGHKLACPLHGARFDIRTGAHLRPPGIRGVQRSRPAWSTA
ncbi:MAG: Rieske 2Fe-2S domain-containing protein [Acidimicrobiia bacterium]|nr:Rieske 2Fe-2S domain-containing protein [Acidimicrobiia bacterium]